ncbi:MAG: type II toxin-antitoxin system VapC family toxin [Chthoniobacterales bacterium]|nr:type II toxin-antitoxin system VapC family toxin [Chthoniobacterales bacterium]
MILVDANILLYAENTLSESHHPAREWWDERLSGATPVCLSWPVLTAFIRIATNARLHQRPLTIAEATERVQSWFDQPPVSVLRPTSEHWSIFQRMLRDGKAAGNLVSDAHLAALAIEHNCILYSTDADFARFKGLKWKNPLADAEIG